MKLWVAAWLSGGLFAGFQFHFPAFCNANARD